jgi:serine/threonine-protein kinase
LRGLDQAKAIAQLQALGLTAVTHQVNSADPAGTVVAQSPAAGTKLKPGQKVNVNIASAAASQVTVPDVTGMNEADAVSTLEQLGLKADIVSVAGAAAQGTVVRQSPAASAQAAKGDPVRIYVSDGTNSSNTTTG